MTKKYSSKKIPQPEDIQVEVPNVDFDEHSGMFFGDFSNKGPADQNRSEIKRPVTEISSENIKSR